MDRELTFSRRSGRPSRRLKDSLIPLVLLCLPSPAGAQELLDRIVTFAESASGFVFVEAPYEGRLKSGQKADMTLLLVSGADYMVVGFCDEECTNLDLILFDPQGREVLADRLPDSEPILMYTAEATGRFTVQVDAPDCSTDACQVMVGVLASTSEPGVGPGEDMAGRLVIFGGELAASGFTELKEPWRGALPTDEIRTIPLTLETGTEYRIAAVCDKDCFDLDIALLDSTGLHITSDQLPDEFPIVAYIPEETGRYLLDVLMVACAAEPCGYRVAAYSKPDMPEEGVPALVDALGHQEVFEGKLAPGDEVIHSGAYLDVFQVEAQPGQRLIVDLQSEEFDTLLRVIPPEGVGQENDDYGQELGHSRVEMEAEMAGAYSIQVTSFEPKATGVYRLIIGVTGPPFPRP